MDKQTKHNLTNVDHWIRLVYMLIFGLLLVVARMVIWVVALLEFLFILFTGKDNRNLRNLGQGTAKWCYQALLFVTFNTNQKPFPFDDWPEIDELLQDDVIVAGETSEDNTVSVDEVPSFTEQNRNKDSQD